MYLYSIYVKVKKKKKKEVISIKKSFCASGWNIDNKFIDRHFNINCNKKKWICVLYIWYIVSNIGEVCNLYTYIYRKYVRTYVVIHKKKNIQWNNWIISAKNIFLFINIYTIYMSRVYIIYAIRICEYTYICYKYMYNTFIYITF